MTTFQFKDQEVKKQRVTPSLYTQEMSQSSEERQANMIHQPRVLELLDMKETAHHEVDQQLFQPSPSELIFQNFTPTQSYKLPLLLRNKDKDPQQVVLELQDSDFFHVVKPKDYFRRVAPGLSVVFTVIFTPQENKDYHGRLVCSTDRGQFEVPIRAIGPRAILDFSDELRLPVCPVKASTQRTQLVRNIGNSEAKFKLDTQSPFSVSPSCGTLEVGESVQVTVEFNPMTLGDHSQDLVLHYHTGEDVCISLFGSCEELNVHLEADRVLLKGCYISLSCAQEVSLVYQSEVSLKYSWTTWPSLQEELLSSLRESSALHEEEREQLLLQCESDPTAVHRLPVLSRALQEFRSQAMKDGCLVLPHSCMTVEPAEGEIWPSLPARFHIVFKPEEAKLYEQTIYCDVTGREARLPLRIQAEGLGPDLQLDYDLMDMGNVFIGDKDYYKVQLHNRGLIDAPFRLSSRDTTFGRCFSFSPEDSVVPAGACQTVDVSFHCLTLGSFSEDLLISIRGKPQPLTVTFRGCVVGPTFHFDVSELNFGDVAFGFPQTMRCTLFNTSLVSMNFALRVLGDGSGSPSVTSAELVSEECRNVWERNLDAWPMEFSVTPAAGSVRDLSDITIKVTLCSNTVKRYRLLLVVDVEGVGREIMSLPINARCCVPDLMVESPVLDFERCFLDHPYEQRVQLTNPSALPACYSVLDQDSEACPSLLFSSSASRGLILPHSSEELPVCLRAKAVGRQQRTLRIAVFGSIQPPLEVLLSCVGQGPVVHVQTSQLDFGAIPVLTDITRVLQLSNQSPIPAHFTASMSRGRSFGRVEPSEGVVPPQSQVELRVVAHLKAALCFQTSLEVSIQDSYPHSVAVSATGTGTTIVSDRPFAPSLDLGTHFSHGPCQYHFRLTNHGQQTYLLSWRSDGAPSPPKSRKEDIFSGRAVLPPISSREKSVFSLKPSRVELFPGCSVDMLLTGSSDSPKVVQERLVCHGIVDQQCSKKILSVEVTCRFVAPMLNISSKQLKFYMEKVPGKGLKPQYEKLIVENVSLLPLAMELSLVEPFALCEASGVLSPATSKSMVLGEAEQAQFWVCFDPSHCQDLVSRVVDELLVVRYRGHPQQDAVELHAEIHFPNLRFSSTTVDFGCVANSTGARRTVSITNCSPLFVSYRWCFLEDQKHRTIREAEKGQNNGEGKAEEGWTPSGRPSPVCPGPDDEQSNKMSPVGVQEVFEIFPIYGGLNPGEHQQVTFSFHGHEDISREVVAQCCVEEGPTYDITVRGEASVLSYSLDSVPVHFGPQLFNHEGEAEVTLRNTGKVGFQFSIIDPEREDEEALRKRSQASAEEPNEDVRPGQPVVIPASGHIDAGAERRLRVLFLPGVPEVFKKRLQLQVAFLPPQDILLTGEGVFPRISLNLPQNLSEECYSDVVQQAREAVERDGGREECMNELTTGGVETAEVNCSLTYEELLHMEIERTLVKHNALAVTSSLLELREPQASSRKWLKLCQFLLPEYVLDFGYVIPGKVISHSMCVTNSGSVAVSFHVNGKALAGSGFTADIDRVKNMPCGQTGAFTVKFDPQGANLPTGHTSVVMPIKVIDGPTVQVRLCAFITVPGIMVSMDTLQFGPVQCGMCQMQTIQLFNHKQVPCSWSIGEKAKPPKKLKRDSQKQPAPPAVFKMTPTSGLLNPGERVNVQIWFSPAEGLMYNRQLVVVVADSGQQAVVTAQGQGEDPQLEFCPAVLELASSLPASTDVEAEVTVRNPCSFPVEFYSLDFDLQYLEEEKILRLMRGYDENKVLLLPPRAPGERLPSELLDYYKEHCSKLEDGGETSKDKEALMDDMNEEEKTDEDNAHILDTEVEEKHSVTMKPAELLISEMSAEGTWESLRQLEMTPVFKAIARHMCVDLSPEGLAAHNRRGIAVIVYGAPLTDKSCVVAALTDRYGGVSLSVDAVVTDVLMKGTSPVSLTARRLYDQTAAEYAKKAGSAAPIEPIDPAPAAADPSEDSCCRNDPKDPQQAEDLGVDVTTLRRLLPEQLLVDILTERFQLSDCYRGIVIDDLESMYTQSTGSTLQVILKAVNNRKHIYVVNLCDSYVALKARQTAQRETEVALQKEEADREEKWLQQLDEEQYDALPEEEKELIAQRLREKKQQQKLREEQEEKRQQEDIKRLTEEELRKKTRNGEENDSKEVSREKSLLEGKESKVLLDVWPTPLCHTSKESEVDTREHHLREGSVRLHQSKEAHHSHKKNEDTKGLRPESPQCAKKLEGETAVVDELQSQFDVYKQSSEQMEHILQHWDRVRGALLVPLPSEDTTTDKQTPVGKRNKKANSKAISPMLLAAAEADKASPQDIIPHVVLNVTESCRSSSELLEGSILPSAAEVLDDMGLGPSGSPNPLPAMFSVTPFPKNREQSKSQLANSCFTFLVPSGQDDKGKEEMDSGKSVKDKDLKGRESQKSKRQTSVTDKAKSSGLSPLHHVSTPEDQHQAALELKRSRSLTTFRWVVPANSEVALKVWFYSDCPGTFEQTFSFELLGTRRQYQLLCRGISTYPSICADYTTLFALSKKVPQLEEGLQKTYVIKPGYFEFGPLLCGKTRDRYKERRYPENTERLEIQNNSDLEAEVQFRFQHDIQAATFLLDPPSMTLKPGQKQELTVWAYPTKLGQMEDSILVHIKDNPEPVIINLSCWGVRPELKLDSKHLHFNRTLVHRQDSCSVTLHNKTSLPVSWRLQGVEELGDEFSVPQDQGIIPPKSSHPLSLHFKAKRPLHVKKILRLEVSDVKGILGTVHTENIQVTAEAYDVALDITPDGFLDFGTIKVFEEATLSLKMKNQGKYEIAYKFAFQQVDRSQPNLNSIFTVSPPSSALLPKEKSTTVQVLCRTNSEVFFREQPVLLCQVIEPSIGSEGEPIATLPIKISVQSVFSRYKITPAFDLDFGPLLFGHKKSQSFTIENHGAFKTDFTVCCMITDPLSQGRTSLSGPGGKMHQTSHSGRPSGARCRVRNESVPVTQNCLSLGVFSVSPCNGSLQPGSQQVVRVDCVCNQLGSWNQGLLIDISDRDPSDQPGGVPYRLLAEVCQPDISSDMSSIFEEHHLCRYSSELSSEQFCNAEGVYVRDENKFHFNKVLVGKTAQARLKLTNISKVPCVLSLTLKYAKCCSGEGFDLTDSTVSIPGRSHLFTAVTFSPQAMQLYSAVFEATLAATRSKVLEFDLVGEGSLPSVCVVCPALRDSSGSPVLQFAQTLVGRRRSRPLVLLNDGNVPAQVQIDVTDKHGVFSLKASSGNTCSFTQINSEHQRVCRAVQRLNVNEQVEFEVSFCPEKPLSVKTSISLEVEDNQCSSTTIQVTAEAYEEMVSLNNIRGPSQEVEGEDGEGGNYELLDFGDCHVDCTYQESFTMTNHSSSQAVMFEWPPVGPFVFFSPQVGHLHAGCSKEVTITFRSGQPVTLKSQPMRCRVSQVEFQEPLEQVADWDDRPKMVQWPSSPSRNKVMKTDPEPHCSTVEGSQRELELRISAVCDYAKFSCSTDAVHFKDTLLYQTSSYQLQMVNHSTVKLEFSWQVLMDPRNINAQRDQGDNSLTPQVRPASTLVNSPALPPFSIEPSTGAIEPGASQNFTVMFSPLEVAQFQGRLLSSLPNLQDGDQAPCISVYGHSLLPHCHFDLEDSDYISRSCRNPEFLTHVEPNTKIIEFNSVGFSVPSTRCFSVLNPTSEPFSFKWRCEDKAGSPFHCLTPYGNILPGKRVKVCFEYVAEQQEVVESFWSFVIDTLSLSIPFLCVGFTKDPLVYLNKPHLDFGMLLVGRRAEQTVDLVNGEQELSFHFSVMQASLLCDDQQSSLMVQPMTGTVAPKDRLPLSVSFTPCLEGCVSFRLVLRVKTKSEPLALTVKADCFTMSTTVQFKEPEGDLRDISPGHRDTLDFGKVGISEQYSFHFLVSNLARLRSEVNFELTGPSELLHHLQAKPQSGTIEVGQQLQSSLFFSPRSTCNLRGVRLSIKVKHGPVFTFAIEGRAVAPSLDFSFTKYNFGKRLLHSPGMAAASHTLVIRNKGEMDISVQCQFTNTAVLQMDFEAGVLLPGAVMEAPVRFYPQEACSYHEKLTFILNGSVTKHVEILGQGIEMKLEVEKPRQRKVNLRSLAVGQKVKRQVVLVNRSHLDLSCRLQLNTKSVLDLRDLTFSPAGKLNLKGGGGSCRVEIQFSPRQHVPPFSAELQAEVAGLLHPVLTIQGCCQHVEVQLDPYHLAFGAVVQNCQARKNVVMMNAGDSGARFQWKTEHFPPELSISPAKGYICPGTEVPFEVTFSPMEPISERRYGDLSCCVEGCSSLVTLTVTGSCIVSSTRKEVVNFVSVVRGSHTQTVPVSNPTNQSCRIRPVLEGSQWSAAPLVVLEPLQNKAYEITYHPLSMTAEGKKHVGSIFFSYPNGTSMLYSLQGTAEPPKAEDTIVLKLPAKTHHTELLAVQNWLSKQQRFSVLMENLGPDRHDATVSLEGPPFICVPASASRDYRMSLFAYREGQYFIKVTFLNEVSGEFLFYLVTFNATPPGVLSTVELETTVRQAVSATVQVDNPLTVDICLAVECKCPDIHVPPQHIVPGQSKGLLSFKYQPLHAGESRARMSLSSSELGFFHYDLLLRALPPPQEKTVHFSTSLGCTHSLQVKFTNYARLPTDYSCKTDHPDFTADKVRLQGDSEASVEVCFEPHELGEVRCQLRLSSRTSGEYVFPLHGVCFPPKAQGPFSIRSGRSITIQFKNVFMQTTTFFFQVDDPCFTVGELNKTLPSKQTHSIVLSFKAPPGESSGPWFGKLTVSSQHAVGHSKPCFWVHYLKGFRS